MVAEDIIFAKNLELHDEGHYISVGAREKEVNALKGIENAYIVTPGPMNKAAYLLPASALGASTTRISLALRKVIFVFLKF